MEQKNLFLKQVEDKYRRFSDNYIIQNSDFLSMEQQSMLAGFFRAHSGEGIFLFGGYSDAERKQVLFMPDYTNVEEETGALEYFKENPSECPMGVLDISVATPDMGKLSHRDYLGALMGEGIKREKVGDIIVTNTGAKIVAAEELVDYLERNLYRVGRVPVTVKTSPIFNLTGIKPQINSLNFTVSSPRIDNIIAVAFGISRKAAVEAICQGKVFVNGIEMIKPDFSLKGGEKVVLRGKGKLIYNGTTGTSKKGKAYINVDKYI